MTTRYTFDENSISDLHKDTHGCRPSQWFWDNWSTSSDDEKQSTWDVLLQQLDVAVKEEKAREVESIAKFETHVATVIGMGAMERDTAIRWIKDATSDFDSRYGDEHFEYLKGLPYGYIAKTGAK